MNEYRQNTRIVDTVEVDTYEKEISSANALTVEAGTTGYCGGNTVHGSRTFFRIQNAGGTDISVKPHKNILGKYDGVDVELCGDSELSTIIDALRFIASVLEKQSTKNSAMNRRFYQKPQDYHGSL